MFKMLIIFSMLTFTPQTVPNEVGNYPVKIEYKEGGVTKTKVIQLTILSENTVVEEGIAIDAHDFTVGKDTELSKDLIIELSNAKAWNTSTGEIYSIEQIEVIKVSDTLYETTIYSFDNISTTVNIHVEKDYYQTLIIEETETNEFDRILEEVYAFQAITYIITLLFVLLTAFILVTRYNQMVTQITKKLSNAKNNVKKK